MFCLHSYSKWSKAYKAHSGVRQSKVCTKCGKLKVRRVKSNEFMGYQSIATGDPEKINMVYEQ